ncbi:MULTISPECIES: phenylacetic acid degradation operon negative regulatory protein PaaX [Sutcliffiella]|uniref:Phenylacetic acid degradation operon negative regulatory protein PaaX n=1 Tax=Sutcliffiella cohnii TaxID=33932 RepID=A0A223KQP1_9BACI|nr:MULTISPECIES: phenylacetic acid degradation operon negative regulatory protein PaaX [Sutcliffiella]AST91789.1 phenylacetic acid degradation operon negative regulatory protein PaaX [Sutcliffiella cohnii]MED4018591.1 phenylacetic acid degradation operon negative regulatory protein PaaX [Sutcliffiella cohnii]WBL13009.1 phenylacetic acid degradation operon negative regulatory protein PaaX [Sutcliffiella sp. NC1]
MNTRSMIFTLYGDYIRHYGNRIWVGSLIRLLNEFGHNDQAVRAAISRMNKQGWVQAEKKGNKSFYFLTERGVKRIDEAAKRIFKLKTEQWDGKWRILMYTIPEEIRNVRDELRKELVWSGFGSISNSCWISPNPLEKQVYDLIEKYSIEEYVDFFVAEYNGPNENSRLIEKSWDLGEINERYQLFIQEYSQKYIIDRNKIQKGLMSDAECFVERTKLVHEYRKFLFVDPGLPDELLPEKWLGSHAASLFSEYYKELAEPASRFFEEVFQEGNEISYKDKEYDVMDHPYIID